MKFDPKKPHGVITNHDWARYEQDGVLYDIQGQPMDQVEEDTDPALVEIDLHDPVVSVQKDFELNNAKDFLTNILADGALPRSVVFKECAANNQNWEKVKTAFADMSGEVSKRRNVLHWKLKTT